jgi:hypothetical protein
MPEFDPVITAVFPESGVASVMGSSVVMFARSIYAAPAKGTGEVAHTFVKFTPSQKKTPARSWR